MSDLPKGNEESVRYPDLAMAQTLFEYEQELKNGANGAVQKESVLKSIEASDMAPFYEACCDKYKWAKDESKLESMRYVFLVSFAYSLDFSRKLTILISSEIPSESQTF
jgi:hypothetical protein